MLFDRHYNVAALPPGVLDVDIPFTVHPSGEMYGVVPAIHAQREVCQGVAV